MMLYAQTLEVLRVAKRYQLGKVQVRRAGGQKLSKHCKGWHKEKGRRASGKGRRASEAEDPTKKVLCQLVCVLAALPVRLCCPCAQKCCSFIHTSAKSPRKSQLKELFITNDSFVAISFSAVQHIIDTYFRMQKGKKHEWKSQLSAWGLCFPYVQ